MDSEPVVLDWKELSMETSLGTLTGQAEESYSAWLEWRKRMKVRMRAIGGGGGEKRCMKLTYNRQKKLLVCSI